MSNSNKVATHHLRYVCSAHCSVFIFVECVSITRDILTIGDIVTTDTLLPLPLPLLLPMPCWFFFLSQEERFSLLFSFFQLNFPLVFLIFCAIVSFVVFFGRTTNARAKENKWRNLFLLLVLFCIQIAVFCHGTNKITNKLKLIKKI